MTCVFIQSCHIRKNSIHQTHRSTTLRAGINIFVSITYTNRVLKIPGALYTVCKSLACTEGMSYERVQDLCCHIT